MNKYLLRVEHVPPSPNRTRGKAWYQLKAQNERAARFVFKAWANSGKPQSNGRKALVKFTFYVRGGNDDLDNRVARLKGIIDCLVNIGALWDDSEEYLQLEMPKRERHNGKGYLEIAIEYF